MGGNEKIVRGLTWCRGILIQKGWKTKTVICKDIRKDGYVSTSLFLDSKITSTPVNRLIRKEVLTENAIYFRTGYFV